MKTSIQPKNGKRSVSLEVKPQRLMASTELEIQKKNEAQKKLAEDIEVIFQYEDCRRGDVGIGRLDSSGAYVEFQIVRCDEAGTFECETKKITLADTLEWVEYMEFSEDKLGHECMQKGPGYIAWLWSIRAAIHE
jgi:hypothetical protein